MKAREEFHQYKKLSNEELVQVVGGSLHGISEFTLGQHRVIAVINFPVKKGIR